MQFQNTFGQYVPEHATLISRPNTAQQPLYASVSPALHQNQSNLQNPSTLSNSQAFPPVPDYIMRQLRSGGFDQSSSSNPDAYGRFSSIPSANLPAFPTNPPPDTRERRAGPDGRHITYEEWIQLGWLPSQWHMAPIVSINDGSHSSGGTSPSLPPLSQPTLQALLPPHQQQQPLQQQQQPQLSQQLQPPPQQFPFPNQDVASQRSFASTPPASLAPPPSHAQNHVGQYVDDVTRRHAQFTSDLTRGAVRASVTAIALEEATEAALDELPDSHLLRRQIQQNEDLRAALNAAISEQARAQQAFAHASPDDMPRAEADNDRASAEAQNIKAQLAQGTKASEDLEKKARAQFRERREEELIDEHAASPAGKAIEAMSQLLTQNFAATAYFNAHRDRDHPSHDDPTPPRSASKSHGTGPTYIPRIFERGLHAEETKGRKLTLDRCSHDTEKWRLLNYLAIQHDSVRDIVEVIRTNNMATIHAKISSDPGLGDLYDAADRFVAKAIHICLDHDEHNYRVASFLLHLERQHNYADIHNSGMMLMPEIDQFCQAKILADYHADQERYDKTTYFTLGDEVDKSIVQMERLRREYVRSHPEESKTPGATIAALLKKMPKGDSILSRIVNDRQSSLAHASNSKDCPSTRTPTSSKPICCASSLVPSVEHRPPRLDRRLSARSRHTTTTTIAATTTTCTSTASPSRAKKSTRYANTSRRAQSASRKATSAGAAARQRAKTAIQSASARPRAPPASTRTAPATAARSARARGDRASRRQPRSRTPSARTSPKAWSSSSSTSPSRSRRRRTPSKGAAMANVARKSVRGALRPRRHDPS